MYIAFLIGSCDISGGTYVLIEHATRLKMRGHRMVMITRLPVNPGQLSWHPVAKKVEWLTLKEAKKHQFDIVLATWWQSVFLLEQLSASNYFYFVQSIESRFFPSENEEILETRDINILKQWCENTYRYPLPVITEAKWIRNYLKNHYNRDSFIVRNGIRKDLYCPEGPAIEKRESDTLRVLIEGPVDVSFKNVEKTIELCKRSDVDEIWLLTSSDIDQYPGVDRCFSKVSIDKTPQIYRSCDVLVKLSYVEGMFGPPLEMFHCGGTSLVYDVTGHDEYIEDNKNSLVVKRDAETEVIHCLNRLKSESGLMDRLKRGALQTASQWPDWHESSLELETIFAETAPQFSKIPSFLASHSRFFLESRENAFRAREVRRMVEREHARGKCDNGFLNFTQVYFHSGEGFTNENMKWDKYQSGEWVSCEVSLPRLSAKMIQIRVDPSVRMGVVQIRSLNIFDSESGRKLMGWDTPDSWNDIEISGTAVALGKTPYLTLECYGEDPQLILPAIENKGKMTIKSELREMSFYQALCRERIKTDRPKNTMQKLAHFKNRLFGTL
jgi:glycosyltransferase involved in cell wall biosynthesis